MEPQDPQALAERIGLLLQPLLDCRVDVPRLLHDALYARDVLLVCEAHRGTELAALAQRYRKALAPRPTGGSRGHGADIAPRAATGAVEARRGMPRDGRRVPTPARDARSADATARPRPPAREPTQAQASARTEADAAPRGDSTIARAMHRQAAPATPPPHTAAAAAARRPEAQTAAPPARDSGLSSFFDRFRASAPATLPPGHAGTRPPTPGPDGPDTWPPEADGPLDDALRPLSTRPLRPSAPAPQDRRGKRWFSPSRWFSRGPG